MNPSRNTMLFLLFVALCQNLHSQNWSTYGGSSPRSGNSEITGPSSVTAPFWSITNAVITLLGENVYTFGDLFATSRVSANFTKVVIECKSLQTGGLVWTSPNLEVADPNVGVETKWIQGSNITVFPNPATDHVYVKVSKELVGSPYYLMDPVGRLLQTGIITHESTRLDIEKLKSGVYLIQVGDQKF